MDASPDAAFRSFGLSRPLLAAVGEAGYETPSPLQQACIPPLLAGRDLFAEGHPGAGKTLAFALPLLEGLDLSARLPQVLVLTPSGAAAVRIAELFMHLARYLQGFHVMPIHGGEGQAVQLRQLERGVHVVVGTPRWTLGHVESGRLALASLRTLVLADADEMLRMNFREDIEALCARAPAARQNVVFAAGRSHALECLVKQCLREPVVVALQEASVAVPPLRQRYWQVEAGHKLGALIRLVEVEAHFEAALVYVHTQTAAERLAEQLAARGYAAEAVHALTAKRQVDLVAARLAAKHIDIVVATDAALPDTALKRISHVIHHDLPCDAADYRARLAAAPTAHSSLLLPGTHEMSMLHDIEHGTGQSIEPLVLPERPREH
ncbi:MAG: DEAD/DEAH box helicase [Pseudomonadota bacterium]